MHLFSEKTILFFLLSIVCYTTAYTQVYDNFSDGDFTSDPIWTGDDMLFQINSDFQLQTNDSISRTAALSTENHRITNTEWQFWINLDFAPSSNSFARIYLASDTHDLSNPLNSVFLQFGESGNKDAIELFHQNGTSTISICRSADSIISQKFTARIKVCCDADGEWSLFADMTGDNSFKILASGNYLPDFSSSYFGVYTKYAASYSKKMFFDDFYAGDFILDTEPPHIEKITSLSENSVQITFNESVLPTSAENISHYTLSDESIQPGTAVLLENEKEVLLTFNSSLTSNHLYTLSIHQIEDLSGNVSETLVGEFAWILEQPFDVIINEIMADPTPVINLPEWEYLELFNRTDFPMNLNNWTLTVGTSVKTFSDVTIDGNGYLIICHEDAVDQFSTYGPALGFSSFQLTNSEQTLILQNDQQIIIFQVTYSDSWYDDELKKNGGWSLELIDIDNFCGTNNNWTASMHPNGGTPGSMNSVFGENPDEENPILLRAEYFSDNRINIFFNESMNPNSVSNTDNWLIDNGLQIAGIFPSSTDYTSAQVIFLSPMEANETYSLTVNSDQIEDCSGNAVEIGSQVFFAKPDIIERNDIIINEILHSPIDNGVQYVELYNRSSKILDTKQLRFSFEKTNGNDSSQIMLPSFLFFPDSYCVLSKSPETIQSQYDVSDLKNFIVVADFPTMIVSEGIIRISKIEDASQEIDAVRYSENMHAALLNSIKGVSLERINPNRPSNDNTNWHSASELAGFGTPGYRNSQFDNGNGEDGITFEPAIFTPNNDGIDDYLNIRYQNDESGYTMNVYIFDSRGNRVRHLINNESMNTEGSFSWDGKTDSGQLAQAGIYIIYIEVFDLHGNVKRWKKTGTLGVKF